MTTGNFKVEKANIAGTNPVQIFSNEEFGQITVIIDTKGNPWFIAKEIAEILEYTLTGNMLKRLDDDEKAGIPIWNISSNQYRKQTVINEPGLYEAVFGSKSKGAKLLKHSLKTDILPTIRKYGGYMTPEALESALVNPENMMRLLTDLKEEKDKRAVAETKKLKAEGQLKKLMHDDTTYSVTEVAKECGFVTAFRLNRFLHKYGFLFKSKNTWVPYSKYTDQGYFKSRQYELADGTIDYKTRITQLGRTFIKNL